MKEYGKVVYILIGLAAILVSYFLGFQKFSADNVTLQEEVDTAQARYDTLKADYANKATYLEDTKKFNKDYEEELGKFDTTLLNEGQVLDLYELQSQFNVLITTATLAEPLETYAFDGSITDTNMTAQQTATNADGTPAETEPIVTSTNINTTYRGVSNTITFTTEGTYENIKSMLQAITDGKKRKVFSNISFTSDSTTENVICNITLSEYAITGDDRKPGKLNIPESGIGRTNIFLNPLGTAPQTP